MIRLKQKKKKIYKQLLCSVILLALTLFVFGFAADRIRLSNESEQTAILEKAVTRTITQCYALEGSYPPDIAYLTTHYGLTYDPDQYLIDYQYIGSNLRPDVTIIKSPANKCQQKMEKNFLKKRVGCPLGEYIVLLQDIDSLDLQYFMQLYRIQQHCIV